MVFVFLVFLFVFVFIFVFVFVFEFVFLKRIGHSPHELMLAVRGDEADGVLRLKLAQLDAPGQQSHLLKVDKLYQVKLGFI